MKMAHALAHSPDSHSRTLGLNLSQPFRGHSTSVVFNLYEDVVFFALKLNQRGFASRVTMDVCQTFLNKSENEQFHFGWKFSEICRSTSKLLRSARPCTYHLSAEDIPLSSRSGGCNK